MVKDINDWPPKGQRPESGIIRLQCPYCVRVLEEAPDNLPPKEATDPFDEKKPINLVCPDCSKQFRVTYADCRRVTFPGKLVKA
jgi:hypothetical protein